MNLVTPTESQVRRWHFVQSKNIREMIEWIRCGEEDDTVNTRASFIIFQIMYHHFTQDEIKDMGFQQFYRECWDRLKLYNPSLLRGK
jgi:hypothetical protein